MFTYNELLTELSIFFFFLSLPLFTVLIVYALFIHLNKAYVLIS